MTNLGFDRFGQSLAREGGTCEPALRQVIDGLDEERGRSRGWEEDVHNRRRVLDLALRLLTKRHVGAQRGATAVREDEVDVVGFYMNPSLDAQVRSIAKSEKYQVTLATVQNMSLGPNALFGELNDACHTRGAGRDIYVVGKEGRIHTIPAVDEQGKLRPRPDIVSDAHSALGTVLSPG